MNVRRTILLLLIIILGVIIAYNSVFMNYVMRSGMGMGMHGHMWYYGQSGNMGSLSYIWILLILIMGIFAYDMLQSSGNTNRCRKCGKYIEDERWRICPVCGNRLRRNGGD